MRFAVWLLCLFPALLAADTLRIYWIDVEGGAATLVVTPGGETVLMDAGWAGFESRDAKRIEHVLKKQAKAKRIDYFITSHFHLDHVGGLPQLVERVPVGKFVDHGDSVELGIERGKALFDAYLPLAQGKRMRVKPGDTLPVEGVEFLIVAARSKFIDKPLGDGKPNPLCAGAEKREVDNGENGKSVGFLVRMGDFEFLDLGDLSWNYEIEMACPVNLLGEVDLYQTTHHGMHMSGAPQQLHALRPTVAVMNNGPRKGGSPGYFEVLKATPGLQDIWQVHRAVKTDDAHNTSAEKTANLDEADTEPANWIEAEVRADGSYTVTNSRNGHSVTYRAR